ncbi:Zinc finger protein-like protein [Emericellopsis cladophorae]|uniref:Zinc finger protein-like protein n=1 Tax=Emericellopsis cladophorae TaxID=2686198 RepID=A0A9P9Y945_9HYPO|nr:Zinc finger protein-like protein [Emericellopsis cladophorae]KAI6785658.1 Zinc finger protein-like protein [Emericellopsis cladophorae]
MTFGSGDNGDLDKADVASQCSSCPSCAVPCDDACDAQPCDETCETEPCTDTCFVEPCPPDCAVPSPPCNSPDCDKDDVCADQACLQSALPPRCVPEAAAAAEALTSFADMDALSFDLTAGAGAYPNYQNAQEYDWSMGPQQQAHMQLPPPQHQQQQQQQGPGPSMITTNNALFDFNALLNSAPNLPQAYDHGFFNHLHEFHWDHQNHSHQHGHGGGQHQNHPCPIDSSTTVESTCRLPVTANTYMSMPGGLGQQPPFQYCGYASHNPAAYADHVLTAHTDLLRQWPLFSQQNPPSSTYINNYHYMQNQNNIIGSQQDINQEQWQQPLAPQEPRMDSAPVSSSTAASVPQSPQRKQSTPGTPLSQEMTDAASDSAAAQVKQPKESQLLDCSNAYKCFWRDPRTGHHCQQNFDSADDLDAHSRSEHVKFLERCDSANPKDVDKHGQPKRGYKCMWLGCKREGDIFSTRAKLSRHLQTHTGYQPEIVKQNLDEVIHLKRKPPQFGSQTPTSIKSEAAPDAELSA